MIRGVGVASEGLASHVGYSKPALSAIISCDIESSAKRFVVDHATHLGIAYHGRVSPIPHCLNAARLGR
jgi:hypothetical protein